MLNTFAAPDLARSGLGSRRKQAQMPFPDFPCNARSFVHMDAKLLPYWHALFDVCPALLRLDPPEGFNLFREFMTWAYRQHVAPDWTYHLSVCRWLVRSGYHSQVNEEHLEPLMLAAAARWVATDDTQAFGVVIAWEGGVRVLDWKVAPSASVKKTGRRARYSRLSLGFRLESA